MWHIFLILIVSAICGSIAGAITGAKQQGCWTNVGVGLMGSIVGYFLQKLLNLPSIIDLHLGHGRFPLLWTIIGSIVFLAVLQLINSKGRSSTI